MSDEELYNEANEEIGKLLRVEFENYIRKVKEYIEGNDKLTDTKIQVALVNNALQSLAVSSMLTLYANNSPKLFMYYLQSISNSVRNSVDKDMELMNVIQNMMKSKE